MGLHVGWFKSQKKKNMGQIIDCETGRKKI